MSTMLTYFVILVVSLVALSGIVGFFVWYDKRIGGPASELDQEVARFMALARRVAATDMWHLEFNLLPSRERARLLDKQTVAVLQRLSRNLERDMLEVY